MESIKKEYDVFKGRRNRYGARLKAHITIRVNKQTIDYFKALSQEKGIAYQTIINL